ncbi:MAG: DUF2971 domain-containing protein [Candidatus Gastranaerophilales bacterium]|nr:DUF2971 domain-containing protein [Candidatus Gastranaerophilales bacterium]
MKKTEYKVELKKFAIKAVKSALTGFNSGIKQSLSDTSIFCLSETKDNLLMWAHYADNHTGVVVKFKIVPETDSPLESIKKVFYTDKIPEFPKFNISNNVVPDIYSLKGYVEELINIISLTKSIHWNYEKEWRIISKLRDKTKTSEIIPFAPEEVADVYLGLKIDSKNKQEIIEITKKHYPQAGIYQAVKSKDKYELIFEQITG